MLKYEALQQFRAKLVVWSSDSFLRQIFDLESHTFSTGTNCTCFVNFSPIRGKHFKKRWHQKCPQDKDRGTQACREINSRGGKIMKLSPPSPNSVSSAARRRSFEICAGHLEGVLPFHCAVRSMLSGFSQMAGRPLDSATCNKMSAFICS